MDLAAFLSASPGRLLPISATDGRTGEEYRHAAFLPDPLPETVALTPATWNAVAGAMQALGRVDQASHQVPNPSILRGPSLRREAQSTSALEGTHALFSDVLEADAGGRITPEIREILNYAEMAEYAIDAMEHRSVSVGLICELQALLLRGTGADGPASGSIRDRQVVIGPRGSPINEARFVPAPPGDLLVDGVRDWVEWISTPRDAPIVVQAALAHYQFEALHPFHDGNGRLGRLAIVLQLVRAGALRHGLLTISPWLEGRRQEYQDQLLWVSQRGDWDSWVRFFARALQAASEQTTGRVRNLLDRHAELRALVHATPLRGVAARIVEDLIAQPVLTPTWAAARYGVSYQAANTAIAKLVDIGVLAETTGRSYDRAFLAADILAILEA